MHDDEVSIETIQKTIYGAVYAHGSERLHTDRPKHWKQLDGVWWATNGATMRRKQTTEREYKIFFWIIRNTHRLRRVRSSYTTIVDD